jgi:hypothetical protein
MRLFPQVVAEEVVVAIAHRLRAQLRGEHAVARQPIQALAGVVERREPGRALRRDRREEGGAHEQVPILGREVRQGLGSEVVE